jgi:hypothetical protein
MQHLAQTQGEASCFTLAAVLTNVGHGFMGGCKFRKAPPARVVAKIALWQQMLLT